MLELNEAQVYAWIAGFVWPFFRIAAIFQSMPIFSHRAVPVRFRILLAASIAIALQPYIPIPQNIELFSLPGLVTVFQQVIVGLAIGTGFRVVFAIFDVAGAFIGLKMGLGFAAFVDPVNNVPSAVFSTLFTLVASVIFLAAYGHHTVLLFIIESFQLIPVGSSFMDKLDWLALGKLGSLVFSVGVQLAMPIVASILAINIGLGFLSRSAPQLHIIQISFAITIAVGFFIVWVIIVYYADTMVGLANFRIPYVKP